MKNIYLLLLTVLLINTALCSDYYYYKGNKMNLLHKEDRIVIVCNESENKNFLFNEINSLVDSEDELKNPYGSVYEIIFKNENSESKSDYYKKKFSKSSLIKFISPAYYLDNTTSTIICADELIIKLKNESSRQWLDNFNVQNGVQITESFPGSKLFVLKTFNGNNKTSLELSDTYYNTGLFEFCEPNFIYKDCLLNFIPNDPNFGNQWNLRNTGQTTTANSTSNGFDPNTYNGISGADMKVTQAWDFTTGNSSFEIGVIDTGIDSTHPDLRANVLGGYDAVLNVNSVPTDSGKHGTSVSGIIAASGNNNLGVAGIAYGCKIRMYRAFNSSSVTTTLWIVRAYQKARQNNPAIINNSWGGINPSSSIQEQIDSCAIYGNNGKGCTLIFGSGNNGCNPVGFPSYLSNVISVGASTAYDLKKSAGTGLQYWWGGNYGSSANGDLDMVAPTQVPTTDIQGTGGYNTSQGVFGDYNPTFNGTSCASPNATGVAALVYSINTNQTSDQVREALLKGCDKIDNLYYNTTKTYGQWNEYTGYGRVNAYNSVRLAAGVDVVPPSIVHNNPESHNSTYPTFISADIIDNGGGTVNSSSAKLIYRTNKNLAGWSAFDTLAYNSLAGNTYTFKIPGFGWETQVQYYLAAKDNNNNTSYFPIHAPDTTNLCYYAVGNIQSVTQKITGPVNINSLTGVASGTTSFASFNIVKSKVRLYLRHARVSDMNIALVSPNTNPAMNMKCLFSCNSSGATTGIINATICDSSSFFWQDGTQPYTAGAFKGDYILRGLNGLNASGNWKLLFYDQVAGTGGTFDSAFVTLYKTSGVSSPSAGINNAGDSIATFDGHDTVNFYLKNKGASALTISNAGFSGTHAAKFSLPDSYPSSIIAGDSGLFKIVYNSMEMKKSEQNYFLDNFENATLDISTNDPSKPVVQISLQSPSPLPVELSEFSSVTDKNNVMLKWSTISETNNSGFDIERKNLNENKWLKIGDVKGAGNSNLLKSYSFEDKNLAAGKYNYRLKQIDFNGNYKYFNLSNEVVVGVPCKFELSQNYPNPFNPYTIIGYELPVTGFVTLKVFDIGGRKITEIVNESKDAGYYKVQFNASSMASGIYFYQLNVQDGSNSFIKTMKMLLVK